LILDPQRQVDMIRSYIRIYEQSGWLPNFPSLAVDRACMTGNYVAALIADTYRKGYRDFDVEKAYAGMKKNALQATMLPWRRGPLTSLDRFYQEQGFYPALARGEKETVAEVHPFERRQAVSLTLDAAYTDWCVAQMAQALGKDDDYTRFKERARNYAKLFDSRIGMMAPRSSDGRWVEGFDPILGGGSGGRDFFSECNSWIYTWRVQHDIPGLMALMGGRGQFAARLDRLFSEQVVYKYVFLAQFPDMTGLIGRYAHGNEPSFHIPYLYNYCGQPWKTQLRVRQIMDVWYGDGPLGICGDEDNGELSSWYVLSAMGFYTVCPGKPVYDLGSPLFDEVQIALAGGKQFTIRAVNVSAQNKYIQSAELNGRPLERPWFTHDDLAAGGTLELQMGPRANLRWGLQD
jgi:predicted alpha-1,2-mannosidase